MSSLFRARLLGAVACLVVGVAVQAAAQQTESRILGKVVDQSQAALPGVTVNVTSKDTGAVRSTVTGGEGEYAVTNLGPGRLHRRDRAAGLPDKKPRRRAWRRPD